MASTPVTTFLFLFLFSISFTASSASSDDPSTKSSAAANFIKAQCSATEYPTLCVQSLSAYANTIGQSHQELAQAALSVSMARAKAAKDFVAGSAKLRGLRKREVEAVKDCMEEMGDSVERLSKSAEEMKKVGGSKGQEEFVWHVSNVETWVSAALTDENTCMDGFSGKEVDGSLKASIRTKVVDVARVTSNALALVTRFASKH